MVAANEKGTSKRLMVVGVQEREVDGQKRTFWPRMGRAFVNHDGSITLILDSFPIGTNKLQIREDDRNDSRPGANGGPRRNGFDVAEARP
jgi:hypothetical protein